MRIASFLLAVWLVLVVGFDSVESGCLNCFKSPKVADDEVLAVKARTVVESAVVESSPGPSKSISIKLHAEFFDGMAHFMADFVQKNLDYIVQGKTFKGKALNTFSVTANEFSVEDIKWNKKETKFLFHDGYIVFRLIGLSAVAAFNYKVIRSGGGATATKGDLDPHGFQQLVFSNSDISTDSESSKIPAILRDSDLAATRSSFLQRLLSQRGSAQKIQIAEPLAHGRMTVDISDGYLEVSMKVAKSQETGLLSFEIIGKPRVSIKKLELPYWSSGTFKDTAAKQLFFLPAVRRMVQDRVEAAITKRLYRLPKQLSKISSLMLFPFKRFTVGGVKMSVGASLVEIPEVTPSGVGLSYSVNLSDLNHFLGYSDAVDFMEESVSGHDLIK